MRRGRRTHIVVIALTWLLCGQARLGHAQAADPARSASARAQFEAGVRHVDAAEWPEAERAFRSALALRDSQVIRYNLASALAEQGKLVEASELAHVVAADPNADPALRENANDLLREVKPRIARLTLRRGEQPAELRVELDGTELLPAQLGAPLLVDPGRHVVRAGADAGEHEVQTIELAEGGDAELVLRAPPVALAESPVTVTAPTAMEVARAGQLTPPTNTAAHDDTGLGKRRRKRLWWGLSGAALAVATAVTLGVLLSSRGQQPDSTGDFDPPYVGVNLQP